MRNINPSSLTEAKKRFLTLVLTVAMAMLSATGASRSVAAVSVPVVHKVQQVERESRAVVRFSVRLYRFYKMSTEKPVIEAHTCE